MSQRARIGRRSGAALAIALTLLAVTGMFVGAMLRQFVLEQRQLKARHHEWQAQWLARSAIERGRAQLARDPEYRGETWNPEVGDRQAEVVIRRSDNADDDDGGISAAAVFPTEHPLRACFEHTDTISNDRAAARRTP